MIVPVFTCCLLIGSALSAEILAVFPHPGKSHFDVFEPLLQTLANRGHCLTVVSFFPQKTPVANYTDISITGQAPLFVNALKFEQLKGDDPFTDFLTITGMGVQSCKTILMSPQVQSLLQSSRKFDLLFLEMFNTDCFLAFAERYRVPYIGVSSSSLLPTMFDRLGSFDNPAYFPNIFFPLDPRMTLQQRIVNTVATVAMPLTHYYRHSSLEHEAASLAIGSRQVDLLQSARNITVALVNTHFSVHGSRPLVPAVVEVGGLHILPPKPLPKDIDQFLNESTEGALLFSMGSVLRSSSFPEEKRQAIMDAFSELPIRIIMKWEEDTLPGKPDNVKLSRWLPQRDIMAHPRVKAFMGHGGLLSTSEAVYSGLPMVLTPMFGDQPNNVAHLVATGAAIRLPYDDISKETVLAALRAVLYDQRYKERAEILSDRFKDRPMSPLDTAVFWTEYVLRHRGAPHLRSPAVDMPWYQLWLIDVAAVLLGTLFVIVFLIYWLIRRTVQLVVSKTCVDAAKKKTQ